VLRQHWNHFVFIDWIVVDAGCRGQGIGRALMDRAVEWAREKSCPGLALETQDNNVTACRFYETYGFRPGGFDCLVYHNFAEVAHEIAINWYLIF
jgi:streptothricin acetyltransferase